MCPVQRVFSNKNSLIFLSRPFTLRISQVWCYLHRGSLTYQGKGPEFRKIQLVSWINKLSFRHRSWSCPESDTFATQDFQGWEWINPIDRGFLGSTSERMMLEWSNRLGRRWIAILLLQYSVHRDHIHDSVLDWYGLFCTSKIANICEF